MRQGVLSSIIFWLTVMVCFGGCALRLVPPSQIYYVTPAVTYLRNSPSYEAPEVAPVYLADRVERLGKEHNGWWQVRALDTQAVGWMDGRLLSRRPLPVETYYVAQGGVPLRDCPGTECSFRKRLEKGEELRKIDQDEHGWTRVITFEDKSIGWVEVAALSPVPLSTAPPVKKPDSQVIYYVGVSRLNLRSLPLASSEVVRVLQLNEQVQELAASQQNWLKVRYLETGSEGWVLSRYLKDAPVPEKVRPARRAPRPRIQKPSTDDPEDRTPPKPEIM